MEAATSRTPPPPSTTAAAKTPTSAPEAPADLARHAHDRLPPVHQEGHWVVLGPDRVDLRAAPRLAPRAEAQLAAQEVVERGLDIVAEVHPLGARVVLDA